MHPPHSSFFQNSKEMLWVFKMISGIKQDIAGLDACNACAGPVNIHDSVQRAMVQPSQNHRDPWFPPFFQEILEDCKMIFGTKEGTPFIYPGTGTGGWEVALANTLSPGDKIVTFRYGQFSHLWVDMMQRLGLDVSASLHPLSCNV